MMTNICVIGAGVIGISAALHLKEMFGAAIRVTVVADGFGSDITSHVAGGLFRNDGAPLIDGYNGPRQQTVSQDVPALSWKRYKVLVEREDAPEIGVIRCPGYRLTSVPIKVPLVFEQIGVPVYKISEEKASQLYPLIDMKGITTHFFDTVLLSNKRYIPWMTIRFKELGGSLIYRHVNSFSELFDDYDIVINCSGAAAGYLCDDPKITAARGQTIRVRAPRVKHFTLFNYSAEKCGYLFPTPDGVVLGGVRQIGNWSRVPTVEDREHIINITKKLDPSLIINEETVISEEVGLRPSRDAIRLEKEAFTHNGHRKWVIHNYGHNDWGVSNSWGSAVIVSEMVESLLPTPAARM